MIVFVDMDGVLADWRQGVHQLLESQGFDLRKPWSQWTTYDASAETGVSVDDMWECIRYKSESFWSHLPLAPWGGVLAHMVRAWRVVHTVRFLTNPMLDPAAGVGKLRWLRRHVDSNIRPHEVILSAEKHLCAGRGRLLIDDLSATCRQFRAFGGEAVLWPAFHNSRSEYITRTGPVTQVNGIRGPLGEVLHEIDQYLTLDSALKFDSSTHDQP